MPDNDERDKSKLDDEALRSQLEELKARLASLHRRVEVLEEKKRTQSTTRRE